MATIAGWSLVVRLTAASLGPLAFAALAIAAQEGADVGAASRAPEQVLEAQLQAFNAADVEAMVANVAEDFVWVAVDSDGATVQLVGRAQFRRSMEAYFASTPGARAEIVGVLVSGNFVSLVERAYWIVDGAEQSQDALAVYEIRSGLIHRAWYYPVS